MSQQLVDEYLAGPALLEAAVANMNAGELDARPVAGKWSTREVVCHLSDCEILYAQRIHRVLWEDKPALANADPDLMIKALVYGSRDVGEEVAVVRSVRASLGRILKQQPAAAFERVGMHSKDGPLTLTVLLQRVTKHIPHHVQFIYEKRRALAFGLG